MIGKTAILIGSALGAIGVALGAFGAHAFKGILEQNQRVATYETAVKYHFVHALALIVLGIVMEKYSSRLLGYSMWLYLAGIIFFAGSLYILSLTGNTKWGAVAPVGGLSLILGWVFLFLGVLRSS